MSRSSRSSRYKLLEKALASLRSELLPRIFSPIGVYSSKILARTVAYRVLAHAEIEEYIENRVWDLAIDSIKALESSGNVNRVIACLLAFSGRKLDFPPDTLAPPSGKKVTDWNEKIHLTDKSKSALTTFRSSITQNHGIRERDILNLLLPVGILPTQLDPAWLSTIDTFGQQRGLVAHHSAAHYRAKHVLDPKSELTTVKNILAGLRDIDDFLNRLLP